MSWEDRNPSKCRAETGDTLNSRLVGGWRRIRAGGFVLLLPLVRNALMCAAGMPSAARIKRGHLRRTTSRDHLQRTGHSALCVDNRGDQRGKSNELSGYFGHLSS